MTKHRDLIVTAATTRGLAPDLVEAVVLQESDGNEWAWNPEPAYKYLWNVRTQKPFRALTYAELASEKPPVDFPMLAGDRDQEWWAQQASWGLMQVMGALARELGFVGPYIGEIYKPELNLQLGCKNLAALMKWAGGNERNALAAYNGGRGGYKLPDPQRYADEVLARLPLIVAAHREG